jgi:hypothetical protein
MFFNKYTPSVEAEVRRIDGFSDPTENSFTQSLQESVKSLNGKPVNKNDPVK